MNPKLVNLVTIIGFGLPIVGYFCFILRYGVNIPYQDGWSDITVIHQCYSHSFSCGTLWTQHNENRILFPNLVVIALAHTTHFNIRVEEFLSGMMLVGAMFLFIYAHKRRSPAVPWLYYCPVAVLACSVVQYGATLWGFQMAWYLVLLALAVVVVCIDRDEITVLTLALAIGAGVIGSFSSLQGLLVWPVGMVLLFYRRRARPVVAAWIVAGCATTALYLYHLNIKATVLPSSLTHHSVFPIYFSIFAIGDVVGVPIKPGGSNAEIFLFGLVIVVMALATLGLCGLRPDKTSASPVGAALICFGLLFSILVALGRHGLGYWGASSSGYTIYDVWVLIGMYMVLLDRKLQPTHCGAGPPKRSLERSLEMEGRDTYRYAIWIVLGFMALQPIVGIGNGLDGARSIHAAELKSVSTAQNINTASDIEVLENLNFYQPPAFTRMQVRIAETLHLTVFAGNGRDIGR
jgi:hypothetical protein